MFADAAVGSDSTATQPQIHHPNHSVIFDIDAVEIPRISWAFDNDTTFAAHVLPNDTHKQISLST
jgi:hypothetical protein